MSENTASQIHINVIDREGKAESAPWGQGESLMEVLRDNGFPILASCGGVCACATCHIYIEESLRDTLGKRSESENELLQAANGFRPDVSRLACQISYNEALNGMTVTLASE